MDAGVVLKGIGAALVLVSLVLPMSSCDLRPLTRETEMTYAFEDLSATDPGSWLEVLLFLWPAIFVVLFVRGLRSRPALVLRVGEPLLLAASIVMVLAYSTLGEVEIGTRVAIAGFAVYGVGALTSDVGALRRRSPRPA